MRYRFIGAFVLLTMLPALTLTATADEPAEDGEKRLGWHGEIMPVGLRKAAHKDVYTWSVGKDLEIELVYVSPGEFIMGADDLSDAEKPLHRHAIKRGYYIGRREITWYQFRVFCERNDRTPPEKPRYPRYSADDDFPVYNVSWEDATAFCGWAGLVLPTEAQWVKAARGTDGRQYPWGNTRFTARLDYVTATKAERCASPYGALGMVGNAWEWCADRYDRRVYERYARGDFTAPASGDERVTRGGWDYWEGLRIPVRDGVPPDHRSDAVGFRVVKASAQSEEEAPTVDSTPPAEEPASSGSSGSRVRR